MKKMFPQSFMLGFILIFLPSFLQILFGIIIASLIVLWISFKLEKDFKKFKKTKEYREIKNFIRYLKRVGLVILNYLMITKSYLIIYFTDSFIKKTLIE